MKQQGSWVLTFREEEVWKKVEEKKVEATLFSEGT